ncbi:MAG: UDP-2,4-diacetamido-2,4,6-trideoxy-beta-L-altropyranose hydrolase [Desulfopila sp.]
MKIVFRTDASLQIGSGHVMRCLTLADVMRQSGAASFFICREHPGHLIELIRERGYRVEVLPLDLERQGMEGKPELDHAPWLGTTQEEDAKRCRNILQEKGPDWLIVDHYGLDFRWEESLKPFCRRLMAIDDLADRTHCCDLLLDQNLGRLAASYERLVPQECTVLVGPRYALLRPEFAELREYSLSRRKQPRLRSLLITMGGVDQYDTTSLVLEGLKGCSLPDDLRIQVVMGAKAPWLAHVRSIAAEMPRSTQVLVNISDMAQRMADCDLVIGAAGSTSWERCCLGVPTLMITLADNQKEVAKALNALGAVTLLEQGVQFNSDLASQFKNMLLAPSRIAKMSHNASAITAGLGSNLLAERLAL